MADHGLWFHDQSVYEELVHVPLLVKRPFQREAAVVREPVGLADLYPTVVELLELREPYPLDGVSLAGPLQHAREGVLQRPIVSDAAWRKRCAWTSRCARSAAKP